MGIKKLNELINKFGELKELSDFKKIAIDTSNYLYTHKYVAYDNSFMSGFVRQILHLYKNGVFPIYVFDGKPPIEKQKTLEDRRKNREKAQLNLEEMKKIYETSKNLELKKKIDQLTRTLIHINYKDIKNLKQLICLMGCTYIEAKGEAEDLCVQLVKNGIVDGCLSEDSDVVAQGGIQLRKFSIKTDNILVYDINNILEQLKLSYEQFVDLSILLGCDNCGKIKNIGPKTALKFIRKYETIENIIINECKKGSKYVFGEDFNYIRARELMTQTISTDEYIKWIRKFKVNLNIFYEFVEKHNIKISAVNKIYIEHNLISDLDKIVI